VPPAAHPAIHARVRVRARSPQRKWRWYAQFVYQKRVAYYAIMVIAMLAHSIDPLDPGPAAALAAAGQGAGSALAGPAASITYYIAAAAAILSWGHFTLVELEELCFNSKWDLGKHYGSFW